MSKRKQSLFIILVSVISAILLGAGLVYVWWDFQILSLRRLLQTTLLLLPFLSIPAYFFYRSFLKHFLTMPRKRLISILSITFAVSLLFSISFATGWGQKHTLRVNAVLENKNSKLILQEIKVNGNPVLMDAVLHSSGWVQEKREMVLTSTSSSWLEYEFQSGIGQPVDILFAADSKPENLTVMLDQKEQDILFKNAFDANLNQRSVALTTSYGLGYLKDYLPQSLLILGSVFLIMGNFCLIAVHQSAEKKLSNMLLIILSLIFAAGTSIYLFAGTSARLFGDDYCYTNYVNRLGLFSANIDFYRNWSGRLFSNFFLLLLTEQRYAPLDLFVLWIASTGFAVHSILRTELKWKRIFIASASSIALFFITLSITPDVLKSAYWVVSSLALLPVFILFPILALLLVHAYYNKIRSSKGWTYGALLFLLVIMISTTHEVASLPMLALTFTMLLLARITKFHQSKPQFHRFLLILCAAAISGLLIILLSPGNYNRQANQAYPDTPNILSLGLMTLRFVLDYLAGIFLTPEKLGGLVAAGAFGFGLNAVQRQKVSKPTPIEKLTTALMPIYGFGLICLTFVPGAYAMSDAIPMRTQIISTYFLVLSTALFGYLLSRQIVLGEKQHTSMQPGRILFYALTSLLVIVMISSGILLVKKAVSIEEKIVQYAALWDERDQAIYQAVQSGQNIKDIQIQQIEAWDGPEQKLHCIQDYYKLMYKDLN